MSYERFRLLYQIVDTIAMDFDSKIYSNEMLVASALYFVIGGETGMCVFPQNYLIYSTLLQYVN